MLTHGNLVSNLHAGAKALDVHQDDVALSFLPLSHGFERMVGFIYLLCGVTVVFAESFETVGRRHPGGEANGDDRRAARLREAARQDSGEGAGERRRKTGAVPVGRRRRPGAGDARGCADDSRAPWLSMQSALAERLVFSKIREALGGRIRYLVSGSAPLDVSIAEFFYGVGLPVIEGYGLTETAPILTVNPPDAPRAGTVGTAVEGVELGSRQMARSSRAARTS